MAITQFRKIKTADDDLRLVQDAVSFVFQDILPKVILDGRLISNVSLNGTLSIDHNLGRPLQGYMIVLKDSNATVWDQQSTNTLKGRTLILTSSAQVTLSVWVF